MLTLTQKTKVPTRIERCRTNIGVRKRFEFGWARRCVECLIVVVCIALTVGTPSVTAANLTSLQSFFQNTLVCQDHETKAVCHVWFNDDGGYYVFYDLGAQSKPASIEGPFQFEGREGTYSLREQTAGVEVCLHPAVPVVPLAAQKAHEFLSEAECYPLALHAVGARWQQSDRRGRQYTFWLMAGR
jgi:hypothetical protein